MLEELCEIPVEGGVEEVEAAVDAVVLHSLPSGAHLRLQKLLQLPLYVFLYRLDAGWCGGVVEAIVVWCGENW